MADQSNDALGLYQRCLPGVVWEYLQKRMRVKARCRVYPAQVVMWLMIWQRLQARGTLAATVEARVGGVGNALLRPQRRARPKRISRRTGGYSQARQRLPTLLCQEVTRELIVRLRQMLGPNDERASYLLDGSSLELEASPGLRKAYPPAENQHGKAHWPVLRVVVLHELQTGLAEEPQWGPMYGAGAVSEQSLAEKALDALGRGSVVVGDRNFGVFSMAWAASQRGLETVLRLTAERARKLAGGPIQEEGEREVRWTPSRFDGRRQGGMPEGAGVDGRLIAVRIGRGKSKQWLYLFTTLRREREAAVTLYGQRWRIETDLRSLKRTVRLHHIAARNENMMEKELLTAVAAYNLVRAVIALAARRHNLSPRQLSFSFVQNVVNVNWHKLQSAPDQETYQREVLALLDAAAEGVHPKRRKRRSFPRAVWHRRHTFPAHRKDPDALI